MDKELIQCDWKISLLVLAVLLLLSFLHSSNVKSTGSVVICAQDDEPSDCTIIVIRASD